MSNLNTRARELYAITKSEPDSAEAIAWIEDFLRTTRTEGITEGIRQAETYGHIIERKSA